MKKEDFTTTRKLVEYIINMRNKRVVGNVLNDEQEDKLVSMVDTTLSLLPKEEQEIIKNEFIYNLPKNWWQGYYSKTTYYRIKQAAMEKFLNLIRV